MNKKSYDITKMEIKSEKIGQKTKIALVSDLHNSDYLELIKIIENETPDFIAVTGDFSTRYTNAYEKGINFLRDAAEIAPVFLSLGNHEVDFFKEKEMKILRETGAIVLDNEFVKYNEFLIGGLTSEKSFSNFEFLKSFSDEDRHFKLLLCHHPEYYNMFLKNYAFDLILSGHAHGGQIRLPLIGGLFSPGQGIFPKLTSGMHFDKMIISRGLGNPNKLPRWFNKPEIIFIEISQCSDTIKIYSI